MRPPGRGRRWRPRTGHIDPMSPSARRGSNLQASWAAVTSRCSDLQPSGST